MNREILIDKLQQYRPFDKDEDGMRTHMISMLHNEPNCFSRSLLVGHFTASAWVLSPNYAKVLLIYHAKLNRWLQPGGHCDGDENVWAGAQKELAEETGIVAEPSPEIFDLDIHVIPEYKDIPEHKHFDIRLLFVVAEDIVIRPNHEALSLKWVDLTDIEKFNQEQSMLRMRAKAMALSL